MFLSSLLLLRCEHFQKKKKKNIDFSSLESTTKALQTERNLHFTTRKRLENFEGNDHWHCRHRTFESFTVFQSGQNSGR